MEVMFEGELLILKKMKRWERHENALKKEEAVKVVGKMVQALKKVATHDPSLIFFQFVPPIKRLPNQYMSCLTMQNLLLIWDGNDKN